MGLDIRTPIGGLFASLGLILTLFGLLTVRREAMYVRSMGINMNLWWGLIMLAFGLMMLYLGRRATARQAAAVADAPPPGDPQKLH